MVDRADFLVEIGTEELPPKALGSLASAFADGILQGLDSAGLHHGRWHSYATPRRLAVEIRELQAAQEPSEVEKRGPPVAVAFDADGRPTRAAEAFAAGCDVSVEALDRLATDKGEWLVYRAVDPGRDACDLLPDIVAGALAALPIPKRMRWGNGEAEFVRPVHWVLMLYGKRIVQAEIMGRTAGNLSRGHRFMAPDEIEIGEPSEYARTLADTGRVIADFEERRDRIRNLTDQAAARAGGTALLDAEVVDEVTALVEWPVAITGGFDEEFLALPEEVLISTLQAHQRYFAVRAADGKLLPRFIAISNLESLAPDKVVAGNERVIRPRLADAAFFWNMDRQQRLADRMEALKNVVFQRELGSLYDKAERVAALGRVVAQEAFSAQADAGDLQACVERAARLAKTDLLTEMVGEFPELQGRMGYYYASEDGEEPAVAIAIEEQYLPRHAGDRLPDSDGGRVLSVADRLDTLAGIFAVGRKPTGNKDPFGLRRAALGLLRILIECRRELQLPALISHAIALQPVRHQDTTELENELFEFIVDRLRAYYLEGHSPDFERGAISAEIFEAVRSRQPASPLDFHERLRALHEFLGLDAAASLSAANKRIANILRGAREPAADLDPALLVETAEQDLHERVVQVQKTHAGRVEAREYRDILLELASLRDSVDRFFDQVMVMAEEPELRRNRLALLRRLRGLFLDVADLSVIPSP